MRRIFLLLLLVSKLPQASWLVAHKQVNRRQVIHIPINMAGREMNNFLFIKPVPTL